MNNRHKLFALALSVLLAFAIVSNGFIGSAFESHNKVKVGCKDLALTLKTWDQLLALAPADDIAENEDEINENGVEPDTYQDIIDRHINDLLNDINKCDLNDAVEQMVEDIDPELP